MPPEPLRDCGPWVSTCAVRTCARRDRSTSCGCAQAPAEYESPAGPRFVPASRPVLLLPRLQHANQQRCPPAATPVLPPASSVPSPVSAKHHGDASLGRCSSRWVRRTRLRGLTHRLGLWGHKERSGRHGRPQKLKRVRGVVQAYATVAAPAEHCRSRPAEHGRPHRDRSKLPLGVNTTSSTGQACLHWLATTRAGARLTSRQLAALAPHTNG